MKKEITPHILIIDDEVPYLHAMQRVFRSRYDVFTAANLTVARMLFQEYIDTIAILLVDLHIGRESGLSFLEEIRATKRNEIRFILMTGSVSPEIDEDTLQASGIDGLLRKPFENEEVITLVENLLQKKECARSI